MVNYKIPSNDQAVLMIHGLGGTQSDFGKLDRNFQQIGYDVYTPCLPGHGLRPDALNSIGFEDYMNVLTKLYRTLSAQYDRVDIIGISMGALLALILSARERLVVGRLVLLSPPVFLDGWHTSRFRVLRHILYRLPLAPTFIRVQEDEPYGVKNKRIRSLIKRHLLKGSSVHYPYVPLFAVQQVDEMRAYIINALETLLCKILIVHSEQDEITSIRSAEFLCKKINSPLVKLVRLQDSYHMITLDNERNEVIRATLSFLQS